MNFTDSSSQWEGHLSYTMLLIISIKTSHKICQVKYVNFNLVLVWVWPTAPKRWWSKLMSSFHGNSEMIFPHPTKSIHFCFCIEAMNCWSQPWVCLVSYGKDKGNFWPSHGRLYNYNLKYSHDLILCLNLVILQTVYYTLCVSAFLKRFDKIFFNLFQECLWTCCEMGRCPFIEKGGDEHNVSGVM